MDETRNAEGRHRAEEQPDPVAPQEHRATGAQDGQGGTRVPGSGDAAATTGVGSGAGGAELQDRWQRAMAELDNQRKRHERQLDQARRAERDRVAAAFLPVLDHLELARQHAQAEPASIVAGVEAVRHQALDVLTALGYRRVDEVGGRFDPAVHEAAQVVRDADAQPSTVVAVLRPGYTTETAVLRPAVVTVAGGTE